eukprot:m.8981 g.8981  ORF g.8981 m.8981 type:complete len:68 (+) comp21006_c0_seq2:89-292(+)
MKLFVVVVLVVFCPWEVSGDFKPGEGPSALELATAFKQALSKKCQGIVGRPCSDSASLSVRVTCLAW